MINRLKLKYILLVSSFLAINSTLAIAQITPDNTLGAESSRVVPSGSIDKIDGGALRDKNLFHSFKEFNINNGQSVYFNNPSGIENILTRVTGKNASNILGTLGVDGAANLFLINPNGIVFGENARLDVQGSFVGSTASGLQFGEQGNFSATNPEAPGLLTVNPNALFFNQINQNAEIRNSSIAPAGIAPVGFDASGLRVPDGKSLLLIGSNINIDGGGIFAFGGKVELGGLAEAGSIELQQEGNIFNLIFPSQLQHADVFLKNGANINVASTGGGSIVVNTRNLNMSGGSTIATGVASGGANSKAGNIEINATDLVKIDGTSSTTVGTGIVNGVLGSGSAGDITINTGSLDVTSNGQIGSASNGEGNAGNVIIKAEDDVSLSGINSAIVSTVAFLGVGDGANIDIQAQKVLLDNSAQIATSTVGKGNSGNIQINVNDSLFVNGGSLVQASSFGQGNAGKVTIEAGNTVAFDGIGSNNVPSGVFTLVGPFAIPEIKFTGDRLGGDIKITTGSLSLTNGAQLNASTNGQGNAGNIFVRANRAVSLSNSVIFSNVEAGAVGDGGEIDINAKSLSLINGSQIQALIRGDSETIAGGKGQAGNININVSGELALFGIDNNNFASAIFSTVQPGTEGNGGNIDITAGEISMNNSATIQSSTFGKGSAGNIQVQTSDLITGNLILENDALIAAESFSADGIGGNIKIEVGKLIANNGAQISTGSGRQFQEGNFGRGGDLVVTAFDSIELDGDGVGNTYRTGLFSETSSPNRGGDLTVNTNKLIVQNGAGISSGASGSGSLGGDGGNLVINATESIDLIGSSTNFYSAFATEANGLGNAGDMKITTSRLNIKDEAFISAFVVSGEKTTNQVTVGNGGNIDITVDSMEVANGSRIVAATFGKGFAGNINIQANEYISFDGSSDNFDSGVFSNVGESGIGNGGDIQINTRELSITNGAEIVASVSNGGQGEAGNIQINADKQVTLNNRAKLFAESASGNGGNINLELGELLLLRNNSQISTTAGNQQFGGDGGNIFINSPFIVALPKENSDITANAFTGRGGNVDIITQGIFGITPAAKPTLQSNITASSETGIQGEISITDPDVNPSQGLIELPSGLVDKSNQIAQICPRGINAKRLSEFYITGRGSLPPSPLNMLEGTSDLSRLATLDGESGGKVEGARVEAESKEIVEAQGFMKTENGEIYLVAQAPLSTPSSHATASVCPTSK